MGFIFLTRSDDVVFLVGNAQLLLRNTLDRIILPLLAAVISCYQTLLFTENLIAFLSSAAVYTVRAGRLNIVSKIVFLCHI